MTEWAWGDKHYSITEEKLNSSRTKYIFGSITPVFHTLCVGNDSVALEDVFSLWAPLKGLVTHVSGGLNDGGSAFVVAELRSKWPDGTAQSSSKDTSVSIPSGGVVEDESDGYRHIDRLGSGEYGWTITQRNSIDPGSRLSLLATILPLNKHNGATGGGTGAGKLIASWEADMVCKVKSVRVFHKRDNADSFFRAIDTPYGDVSGNTTEDKWDLYLSSDTDLVPGSRVDIYANFDIDAMHLLCWIIEIELPVVP